MQNKIYMSINFKDKEFSEEDFKQKQSAHLEKWASERGLQIDKITTSPGSILFGIELSPLAHDSLVVAGGIVAFAFKAIAQDIIVKHWRKMMKIEDTSDQKDELDTEEVKKMVQDINNSPNVIDNSENSLIYRGANAESFTINISVKDDLNNLDFQCKREDEITSINLSMKVSTGKKIHK